jgi:hypothetical protein
MRAGRTGNPLSGNRNVKEDRDDHNSDGNGSFGRTGIDGPDPLTCDTAWQTAIRRPQSRLRSPKLASPAAKKNP